MYYTHLATITTKSGQMPELLRKAESEILPLIRDLPGFVGYSVVKNGEVSAIACSLWLTQDQAKQSIVTSENVINKSVKPLLDTIQNHVGIAPFVVFTGDLAVTSAVNKTAVSTSSTLVDARHN